jgi:hypothetical protein
MHMRFLSRIGRRDRAGGRCRRGAVLVMATVAMTGLMVITAIAVDLSRLFVLRTELQTAADAAALAAAMQLNGDRSRARAFALVGARTNQALAGTVDVDSVRFGVWDPKNRTLGEPTSPLSADAAQVIVGRSATYLLGRLISDGPVRVTARATAWAGAPAMRANCVTPWFILHHDFMEAFGKAHGAMLSHEDIRSLRDTATNKRWLTVRINRNWNNPPDTGTFYGMIIPSHNSGKAPEAGHAAYRRHITECTTMERGWVAKVENIAVVRDETWPGLEDLCKPLVGGVCLNGNGKIGVPITVSVFCKGPEHVGGNNMWFQVEWMSGFMLTGAQRRSTHIEITGYLIPRQGTGEVAWDGEATGLVRTILVR